MKMFFERATLTVLALAVVSAGYLGLDRDWALAPQGSTAAPTAEMPPEILPAPFPPRLADVAPPRRPGRSLGPDQSVDALSAWFRELDYDLEQVHADGSPVPEAYLASLPPDLGQLRETKERKRLFFQVMLPLILRVNQDILIDRQRLWQLRANRLLGRPLDAVDRLWLTAIADRYGTAPDDIDALLTRVDVIPPSLALAQAAKESGWGTSRFARRGNAMFGQWTTAAGRGLVPLDRDPDKDHLVRAFATLKDSVRAYMLNLNTHRAYRELRAARADTRRAGDPLNGLTLAHFLFRYSELREEYVAAIRAIIRANGLIRLDDARLAIGIRPSA